MHLLIPFTCFDTPGCQQILATLRLPRLDQLLRRLTLCHSDMADENTMTPPHERALARLYGIPAPDGCIPWAAREVVLSGQDPGDAGWAWITPAHWEAGGSHIAMHDPRALDLQQEESRTLLEAMRPYFDEDGIILTYVAAQRWLACAAVFGDLASASLDRVSGRDISAWIPTAGSLRQLQNEMQMLLYTHPVNDARQERGAATVNSFWISGTGRWPPSASSQATPDLLVADNLRDAAFRGDWPQWARCWIDIDTRECARLLQALHSGDPVQLTLCGERGALTLENTPISLAQRLRRRFTQQSLQSLQGQL